MSSSTDGRVYSLRVYLYPSIIPQSGFSRVYQRNRSVPYLGRARHRTRLGNVHVFDFHRDARTCLVCVLLHVVPRQHRNGCLATAPAQSLELRDKLGASGFTLPSSHFSCTRLGIMRTVNNAPTSFVLSIYSFFFWYSCLDDRMPNKNVYIRRAQIWIPNAMGRTGVIVDM